MFWTSPGTHLFFKSGNMMTNSLLLNVFVIPTSHHATGSSKCQLIQLLQCSLHFSWTKGYCTLNIYDCTSNYIFVYLVCCSCSWVRKTWVLPIDWDSHHCGPWQQSLAFMVNDSQLFGRKHHYQVAHWGIFLIISLILKDC